MKRQPNNAPRFAVVNTRILGSDITGVQRYLMRLLSRWRPDVDTIAPARRLHGTRGHLWEQTRLPMRLRGRVLFSPANTGPLSVGKQVVTVHDVATLDHPEWFSKRFAHWYRFLTPKLLARVRHVVTISEFTRQRILEHVNLPAEKVSVIYNGVDARFNAQAGDQRHAVLSALGLPACDYVLCVGTMEPRKNLTRLLAAWRRVQGSMPHDLSLIVCGAPGASRIFSEWNVAGDRVPRVHFTGHVPDHWLPALYAGATCFVFPSIYEGFGLPPLEAMACGVPVLASNRSAIPEVVGDAAWMIDPFDVNDIANGLLCFANDATLRHDYAARGLQRAQTFSWDTTARQTRSVLLQASR